MTFQPSTDPLIPVRTNSLRACLLITLITATQCLRAATAPEPGSVDSPSWRKGPLVEIQRDGSTLPAKPPIAIGEPAFQTLTIRKESDATKEYWSVSGVVCSTNAGGTVQGAAIYAGYANRSFELVAMSNLKGDVLFTVTPMADRDGKPIMPTHLYV